jgi:hypothetical protein
MRARDPEGGVVAFDHRLADTPKCLGQGNRSECCEGALHLHISSSTWLDDSEYISPLPVPLQTFLHIINIITYTLSTTNTSTKATFYLTSIPPPPT